MTEVWFCKIRTQFRNLYVTIHYLSNKEFFDHELIKKKALHLIVLTRKENIQKKEE